MKTAIVAVAAFLVDILIADPRSLPHPVRVFGRVIVFLEKVIRGIARRPLALRLGGVFLALCLPAGVFWTTKLGLVALSQRSQVLGLLAEVYLVATTLALKGLAQAAEEVRRSLVAGNLQLARERVAAIVGRDTANLGPQEVVRAAVESVAENTVDAVVAPLFYTIVGGAPLALAYRAVNTLDSMVGYRDERYRYLGWASARLDDLANFLPARLAGALFVLAAVLLRGNWRRVWRTIRRDGRKHPSPNSGISEAAVAGFLGVRLGGPAIYQGVPSFRPYLGESLVSLAPEHIGDAVRLLYVVGLLALLVGVSLRALVAFWGW
uniref:Cobalamin biosynthesis protein CobD n=1 Tax=Ammonifex degensii TaxID=42838 RepID=A0A7C1FFF6_9THEO